MARKTDMSALLVILGEVSKMWHDEPMMVCAASRDQTCASTFLIARITLKRSGEKTAPAWWCHLLKCSKKATFGGVGVGV
jgi:hypothetical protein